MENVMKKTELLEKKRKYAREYMKKYYAKKNGQKKREKMVEEVLLSLKKVLLAV
jgi:hypothetical protein